MRKSGISISIYSEKVLILQGTEHFICVNSLATCVTFNILLIFLSPPMVLLYVK